MTGATIARESEVARPTESTQIESKPTLQTVPCPHCDCRQFHWVLDSADAKSSSAVPVRLVRCFACSLLLTNPRPSAAQPQSCSPIDELRKLPESTNASRWHWLEHLALRANFGYPPQPASLFTKILALVAMWKFHSRWHRHEWIPFRFPGRLLDISNGADTFSNRMQSFGWTVTSVNHPTEIDHQTGGESKPSLFDAITMWHVLQRSPDPRQLVRSAAKLLRPGGLLVIEVPNIESWTFAEFREHWFGLDMPRHLQHFNQRTLCAMIPQDQLRIVEIQQVGMRTWIKRSAERAVAAGRHEYRSWIARGKSLWAERALRSETANQADGLRIIAERRF